MLGRRNLLGLIMGGGAAAVVNPKVSLKEAAGAIGIPIGAPLGDIVDASGLSGPGPQEAVHDPFWDVMDLLRARRYAENKPLGEMPAHIASKKSWSAVFKASEFTREEMIYLALEQKLRRDMDFRNNIFGSLFGIGGDNAGQR